MVLANISPVFEGDDQIEVVDSKQIVISAADESNGLEDRLPVQTASIDAAAADQVAAAAKIHPWLHKVPVDQRKVNPEAYTPHLFSFGLYHRTANDGGRDDVDIQPRHDELLQDGEYFKRMTAKDLLSPQQQEALIDDLHPHRFQIAAQYYMVQDEHIQVLRDIPSELYRTNILSPLSVDAITIVAATFSRQLQLHKLTPLIYPVARLVLTDVLLLENQVPVFLLDLALRSIVQASITGNSGTPIPRGVVHSSLRLEDTIHWYCIRANPFPDLILQRLPAVGDDAKGEPLLSFLYDYLCQCLDPPVDKNTVLVADPGRPINSSSIAPDVAPAYAISITPSPPQASQLLRCGVQFRVSTTPGHVQFNRKGCVLFLPKLTVNDTTVRVLHNLLAYEATARHPHQFSLVSYIYLMDCLIDTPDDVDILVNAGILCNNLGSHEELASMWNKLCMCVSYRTIDCHRLVMEQLDAISKQRWRKWKASFTEVYWEKQPWLLFSILAATVLLILSLLQTIFTVMAA